MTAIRRVFHRTIILGLVGSVAVAVWRLQRPSPPPAPPPSLSQLRTLTELLILRVGVHDVVEHRLEGYSGSVEVVLLVRGDVSLGVDLEQARWEAVDGDNRTALLCLPQPTLFAPRLDQVESRVVAVRRSGLWLIIPDHRPEAAAVARAMASAQARMHVAVDEPERRQAREHTETVMRDFCSPLGWNVQVRWD
jgi:hypothetical protein